MPRSGGFARGRRETRYGDPVPAPGEHGLTPRQRGTVAGLVVALMLIAAGVAGAWWAVVAGDGYQQALPLHVLVARIWRSGELPVWNPYTFSGSPLMANGIAGVWYPVNLLFLVLPPVVANNVVLTSSWVFAATGMYAFARHLTGDRVPGLVAGVAFAGSGFFLGHAVHQAVLASACWLPWALYGVERCRVRLTAANLALGGGAVALAALGGQGQTFAMVVMAVIVYGLLITGPMTARPLLVAALVVVTGVALGAVQIVPTLAVLRQESFRLSYGFASQYSFPLSHLPLLVFPFLFGSTTHAFPYLSGYHGEWNLDELNGYVGAAALVFAAIGLRARWRDRRVAALAGLGAIGLLLASAGAWPLGHLWYMVPLYGNFRDWGRYVLFVDMAVASLAAFGVAELRCREPARIRAAARSAAVALAVLAIAAVAVHLVGAVRRFEVHGIGAWAAVAMPLSAALAAAIVARYLVRPGAAGAVLAILLVSADSLLSFGVGKLELKRSATTNAALALGSRPSWGPLAAAGGGIARFMLVGGRTVYATDSYPDISDAQGLRSANGYVPVGLVPRAYSAAVGGMDYEGNVPDTSSMWSTSSHLLDLLRVTTVVFDPNATFPTPGHHANVSFGSRVANGLVRYVHHPALPDAFLVGDLVVRPRHAILAAIDGSVPWNPLSLALAEARCAGCGSGAPGPAGTIADERWTFDGFTARVENRRRAILVISQAWFPGWQATVDHRAAPVIRVDGILQGVAVGAGAHRVVLSYHAPGLWPGIALTGLTAALLLGWGLAQGRVYARPPSRGSSNSASAAAPR